MGSHMPGDPTGGGPATATGSAASDVIASGAASSAGATGSGADAPAPAPTGGTTGGTTATAGPARIRVFGVSGDDPSPAARQAAAAADLVVAGRRHLDRLDPRPARSAVIGADVAAVLDAVAACGAGTVCVLASGDPGFFGMVRPLAERFGPERLEVVPAPSSVALAFAAAGLPWDDATVVSAHGRPLADAARVAAGATKAAVLVSPDAPPEALGAALVELGATDRRVVVASRLGHADQEVTATDLAGLAGGRWDPLSVVVVLDDGAAPAVAATKALAWGRPERDFAHRDGMVTKAEVRAIALGKLALPAAGVLWDVGAGSGSVGVEAAALAPRLSVWAVDPDPAAAAAVRINAARHGVNVRVVAGAAPGALAGLPDPDRAFVGGGGLAVLDAVLARLRPGGTVVATYAAMDRAVAAADRLGSLVEVACSRGVRLPGGGLRLAATNPVFVVWGPDGDAGKGAARGDGDASAGRGDGNGNGNGDGDGDGERAYGEAGG